MRLTKWTKFCAICPRHVWFMRLTKWTKFCAICPRQVWFMRLTKWCANAFLTSTPTVFSSYQLGQLSRCFFIVTLIHTISSLRRKGILIVCKFIWKNWQEIVAKLGKWWLNCIYSRTGSNLKLNGHNDNIIYWTFMWEDFCTIMHAKWVWPVSRLYQVLILTLHVGT